MVHLSPLFCAFVAISANRLWESGKVLGRAVAVAQVAIVLVGVASSSISANSRNLQRLYQPTVAFLNSRLGPRDLVFARSEFYFGLQCRACLRDDGNLGAISGRIPDYIVLDPDYNGHLAGLRETDPGMYRNIEQRLRADYREVFRNANYQVLQRTTDSEAAPGRLARQ